MVTIFSLRSLISHLFSLIPQDRPTFVAKSALRPSELLVEFLASEYQRRGAAVGTVVRVLHQVPLPE